MEAYRTIWEWAGRINNVWGRIKILVGALGLVTVALSALWLVAFRNLGPLGVAVLAMAVVAFLISGMLLIGGHDTFDQHVRRPGVQPFRSLK